MTRIALLDADGVVENVIVAPASDSGWAPPPGLTIWDQEPIPMIGARLIGGEFIPPAPAAPVGPVRISRIDFRRLLKAEEAARFRILSAQPAVTPAELAAAFDPETPNIELQIKVAVEDAIQQWNLLDSGVIELDHPETAEFLQVMALAGMFGDQAAVRIPKILAQESLS